MSKFFSSIYFWLAFFFLLRLYGITNPPLEIGHNERQCFGLMVAQKFYEGNNDIMHPRFNGNEGVENVVSMEFPFLYSLTAFFYRIFGYHDWFGRLITLFFSTLGVFYFHEIIRKYVHEKSAFFAALLLTTGIWFTFSRKIMPDTFCMSLTFIGLYYGLQYFYEKKSLLHLFLFFVFATLGILSKIPAIYVLSCFIFPILDKKIAISSKIFFSITTFCVLCVVYYWYFIWNIYLMNKYNSWYNLGSPLSEGVAEILGHLPQTLEKYYFNCMQSYIAFATFLAGTLLLFRNKETKISLILLISSSLFFAYMIKSGRLFHHHDYYVLPFAPVMSLVAAYALSQIPKPSFQYLLFSLLIIEAIANQNHDFRIHDREKYKLALPQIADSLSAPTELLAFQSLQELYLSQRDGWVFTNSKLKDSTLQKMRKRKCKYLFFNKKDLENIPQNRLDSLVFENEHYKVYSLKSF